MNLLLNYGRLSSLFLSSFDVCSLVFQIWRGDAERINVSNHNSKLDVDKAKRIGAENSVNSINKND